MQAGPYASLIHVDSAVSINYKCFLTALSFFLVTTTEKEFFMAVTTGVLQRRTNKHLQTASCGGFKCKSRALTRHLWPSGVTLALGVGGATVGAPALAQDEVIEEVVVTGIRGSLIQSADVKRNSRGITEAITAEDIGKFPDTNLAESLQRITGVSIDRAREARGRRSRCAASARSTTW